MDMSTAPGTGTATETATGATESAASTGASTGSTQPGNRPQDRPVTSTDNPASTGGQGCGPIPVWTEQDAAEVNSILDGIIARRAVRIAREERERREQQQR